MYSITGTITLCQAWLSIKYNQDGNTARGDNKTELS